MMNEGMMNAPSMLRLTRPLVAFDLETTGLDVANDRIVEISCVKLHLDHSREVRTKRINPGRPISAAATAIHGIRDEDVKNEPSFAQLARGLLTFFEGTDLTGFNIEHFDLPLLVNEFGRVSLPFPSPGTRVVDSFRIFTAKEPRDLSAAHRFYCGAELGKAHNAEVDAKAAADILFAQVARYADVPKNLEDLHSFCHPVHPDWLDPDGKIIWRGETAVLGFGKHRDRTLEQMAHENPDYLRWMATADFSPEVVRVVKAALRGEFPHPPKT
jgi:DNA polymerase-3 subunit epsilon